MKQSTGCYCWDHANLGNLSSRKYLQILTRKATDPHISLSVHSPLLFRKAERTEVRDLRRTVSANRNPHPALSLEERKAGIAFKLNRLLLGAGL